MFSFAIWTEKAYESNSSERRNHEIFKVTVVQKSMYLTLAINLLNTLSLLSANKDEKYCLQGRFSAINEMFYWMGTQKEG